MKQSIVHVALVVRDYDEAIEFYTTKLNFSLIEDTYIPEQDKRWVVVAPPGSTGTTLLLARPSKPGQEAFVGNQTGGRVTFFLATDDFWRDYNSMVSRGIKFVREPKVEGYGTVAVFEDLYGNLWDLLELKDGHGAPRRPAASTGAPAAPEGPATLDLRALEGAWRFLESGSVAHARYHGGELRIVYRYADRPEGLAELRGLTLLGGAIFGRFRWLARPISGYTYLRFESRDRLVGGWWPARNTPEDRLTFLPMFGETNRTTWIRQEPPPELPHWAQTYFIAFDR